MNFSPISRLFLQKCFCLFSALLFLLSMSGCRRQHDFVSAIYTVPVYSTHSFVYDYSTGTVNKQSADGSDLIYPASITKLLTALTALDILSPESVISPGNEVYFSPEGASSAYIRPHHKLTLEMLIEAMLLPSGNEAAYAIACACGRNVLLMSERSEGDERTAVNAFVARMNEYAEALGCTGSSFTVPDGFAGNEHYSTLDDMILICREAAENAIISKYAAMYSDSVVYASGHTNTWTNTNEMLNPDSGFYNPYVIGLKTGSLADNYSLVTLYDDGENRLLIGVFGAQKEKERYIDTAALIQAEIDAKKLSEKYQ